MEQLSQLWYQLETVEFWINIHHNAVCIKLQNIEAEIKKRQRILKRILRLQLREYRRD